MDWSLQSVAKYLVKRIVSGLSLAVSIQKPKPFSILTWIFTVDIQNMVEKLGAKYEKFDIGKCTHLITAPQYANIKKG